MSNQYGLDAAALMIKTEHAIVDLLYDAQQCNSLVDLLDQLRVTRNHVLEYLKEQIETQRQSLDRDQNTFVYPSTLSEAVDQLAMLLEENKAIKRAHASVDGDDDDTAARVSYFQTRSIDDTMLFRLVVILQLCLIRIGYLRRAFIKDSTGHAAFRTIWSYGETFTLAGLLSFCLRKGLNRIYTSEQKLAVVLAGMGTLSLTAQLIRKSFRGWWVSRKLQHSIHALDYWNSQWIEERSMAASNRGRNFDKNKSLTLPAIGSSQHEKSYSPKRLQKYKSTLQLSEGEVRFFMLKRFMNVFYSSVDAAVRLTSSSASGKSANPEDWRLQLAIVAAATYYTLTGAGSKAVEITSSSHSARRLLEKAWGMVSLPAIKNLSLRASKLAKGAAVADRIEIGGVPCFVLSKEPVPELAAGLRLYHRRNRILKQPIMHRLSTIDESKEHSHVPSSMQLQQPFAKGEFRQHDVILHLTGGGFFAHFIGSDLPYLLDWSHATGAVVICPEYALLPEHKFPRALQDIEAVYETLLDADIAYLLGFEVNRIILSGESVGGNLAAALCMKLQMKVSVMLSESEDSDDLSDISEGSSEDGESQSLSEEQRRLPDALLLSCPVLNLTGETLHADDPDNADPVLPTGLVSAISEAYVPSGVRRNIALISPLYASDELLKRFPPTLIFASSNDVVLDDSVLFNQRLRNLGVPSELRAVENLPHAYLGLGTAGFPEAQQAQDQIQQWLIDILRCDKGSL